MTGDEPQVRPETEALEALIGAAIAKLREAGKERREDAVLFLGNPHHAFPALVVRDPVLEPVDKIVWMVIAQAAQGQGAGTAFPSYEAIARAANIASVSTVSRAIAILRATRWLSLCARVRDAGGRFRGSVYALHDEPLPLADALHLDPDYMRFLETGRRHHHARVGRVAGALLASLDEDIAAGFDLLAPESTASRRLEAMQALEDKESSERYFSFRRTALAGLSNQGARDHHQKSKAVADRLRILSPQKSKAVSPGSSTIDYSNTDRNTDRKIDYSNTDRKIDRITTTTTTGQKSKRENPSTRLRGSLAFPARLSANERELAARYLLAVPEASRQAVLDELEGRLRSETRGASPVYDALRYLHRLCLEARQGAFEPNLGLAVRAERERDAEAREGLQAERKARDTERARKARTQRAVSPLAEVRKRLGMPPFERQKGR